MGSVYTVLKIYSKTLSDKETRYILYDFESGIPYFYSTERLQPVKLYIAPNIDSDIEGVSIDRYAGKNNYTEIYDVKFIRESHSKEPVCLDDDLNLEIFKSQMQEMLNRSINLSNWDVDVFSMCRKVSSILNTI